MIEQRSRQIPLTGFERIIMYRQPQLLTVLLKLQRPLLHVEVEAQIASVPYPCRIVHIFDVLSIICATYFTVFQVQHMS